MIKEAFVNGGWGMIPTTLFGLVMVGVALAYATRPQAKLVPLMITSGVLTLVGGSLGFVTGLIKSLEAIGGVDAERRFIWLIGLAESLNNLGAALTFVLLAMIAASIGAFRIARSAEAG